MSNDVILGIIVGVVVGSGCFILLRWASESVAEVQVTNFDRIGTYATVIQLTGHRSDGKRMGRVRVGNELWRAVFHTTEPRVGETVVVQAREGMTLICDIKGQEPGSSPRDVGIDFTAQTLSRIAVGFGANAAGTLLCLVMLVASLALFGLPSAASLGVCGFFAPFVAVLVIIFINAVRSPDQSGLTIGVLRGVIAGTCALAAFSMVVQGFLIGLLPLTAALILALFDPFLSDMLLALAMGGGVSDG